jgi:hypothetical protein
MTLIPALGRQRQEAVKFKFGLGYTIRSCLKQIKSKQNKTPLPQEM